MAQSENGRSSTIARRALVRSCGLLKYQREWACYVPMRRSTAPALAVAAAMLFSPAGAAQNATPVNLGALSAVTALRDQDAAVLRVGERLVTANYPFCNSSGRSAGMTVQLLSQYGRPYRAAARSITGVANRPTVTLVAEGGAAASAGLLPGDVLVAVNGHEFVDVEPHKASGDFGAANAALDTIDAALAKGETVFRILRKGLTSIIVLTPRSACQARFDVRSGRGGNAWSDGANIQVASDVIAATTGDDELAVVLAHELAHNMLRHPQRLKAHERGLSRRSSEMQADRLSVYLLDAAGFPATDAVAFWSRWGRAHDKGILSDRTHPGWKQRVAAIGKEIAAIATQRKAGHTVEPPTDLAAR